MKNISNLKVDGPVVVHLRDGQLVAKGEAEREEGRLIGHARVERQNGDVVIHAEGSLVLSLPQDVDFSLRGVVNDAVVKRLRAVAIEQCHGSLNADELGTLRVEGPIQGSASLREIEGEVSLDRVMGNLSVKQLGALRVGQVYGNASVKGVSGLAIEEVMGSLLVKHGGGDVAAGAVHGNASLKHVATVRLGAVDGDLSLTHGQALSAEQVRGDVALRHVSGAITLGTVEGDLTVESLDGPLTVEQVRGDASLRGRLQPGSESTLRVAGDLTTDLKGNVHIVVRAGGDVTLGQGLESETDEDGTLHVYLGAREGATHLSLDVQGDVCLNADECQPRHRWHEPEGDVVVEVDEEIRRAMEEVRTELKRASQTVRTELKRAFQEVDEATNGPAGNIVRSTVRDLLASLRPPEPPTPPVPPTPPDRPRAAPSPEELQAVLKMVEEGTITAEEADELIRAMTG